MTNLLSKPVMLILVQHPAAARELVEFAVQVGGADQAGRAVHVDEAATSRRRSPASADHRRAMELAADRVEAYVRLQRINLIVTEWNADPAIMQFWIRRMVALDVPALFLRAAGRGRIRRVFVATAGGAHTLDLLWVAQAAATARDVPLFVERVVREGASPHPELRRPALAMDHLRCRMVGIDDPVHVDTASSLAEGILSRTRPNDLVVLGAPAPVRLMEHFAGSTPDQVFRAVRNPMVMLLSRAPRAVSLRNLFWGQLVQVGVKAKDPREVISMLTDVLIHHNQVPASCRLNIIHRAVEREERMPMAVDCETAFPHVILPGFVGVAGCMGIAPHGVRFGGPRGTLARFIFLLITPEGYCDGYLSWLSRIAQRMIQADLRRRLLECRTPVEVMNVLEPLSPAYPAPVSLRTERAGALAAGAVR